VAAAPEWRFDPLTGRRVLISPARAERPIGVGPGCPFCEGHEAETPPEVYALRDGSAPDGPGWRVRVVPNRYAALQPLSDLAPRLASGPAAQTTSEPVARTLSTDQDVARGVAEVFLESPRHETKFRNLDFGQMYDIVRVWRDRLAHWRADSQVAFAQVFKNEGPRAGASVEHCHSQLIGILFVPALIEVELNATANEDCAFCRWMDAEIGGPRCVYVKHGFAAICPTTPRFPGETWLLPRAHAPRFEDATDKDLGRLAINLLDLLDLLARAFGDPDYNLIVKSAPFGYAGPYHWRIEILPRTTTPAGWEWGTGLLINTLFPERAAEMLRSLS
jgi:UDPglucose--hexose-1-phosphate uridylyltransferase